MTLWWSKYFLVRYFCLKTQVDWLSRLATWVTIPDTCIHILWRHLYTSTHRIINIQFVNLETFDPEYKTISYVTSNNSNFHKFTFLTSSKKIFLEVSLTHWFPVIGSHVVHWMVSIGWWECFGLLRNM